VRPWGKEEIVSQSGAEETGRAELRPSSTDRFGEFTVADLLQDGHGGEHATEPQQEATRLH